MPSFSYVLLAVASPETSARFYEKVLQRPPVEQSPSFVLFVLDNGLKLGLWKVSGMEPPVTAKPGAAELCFTLAGRAEVDDLHEAWWNAGIPIVQTPTAMDFGYTFTALDPDGHRVRAFVPEM